MAGVSGKAARRQNNSRRVPSRLREIGTRLAVACVIAVTAVGAGAQTLVPPGQSPYQQHTPAVVSGCPTVERVDLAIEPLNTPVRYFFNRSIHELAAVPGRTHAPPGLARAPVLGLSTVRVGIETELGAIFSLGANATVCGRLSLLQVHLGYQERSVLIARELPRGTCISNEVIGHEKKHVAVDDVLLDQFVTMARPRLEALVARIGPVVARSQAHAMNVIRGQIDREMEALAKEMNRERDRRQAEVDTLQEYRRVSESCGGEVLKYLKVGQARM